MKYNLPYGVVKIKQGGLYRAPGTVCARVPVPHLVHSASVSNAPPPVCPAPCWSPQAVLVFLTPPVWASLPHVLSSLQVTQIKNTHRSALLQPRRPPSRARGQTRGAALLPPPSPCLSPSTVGPWPALQKAALPPLPSPGTRGNSSLPCAPVRPSQDSRLIR